MVLPLPIKIEKSKKWKIFLTAADSIKTTDVCSHAMLFLLFLRVQAPFNFDSKKVTVSWSQVEAEQLWFGTTLNWADDFIKLTQHFWTFPHVLWHVDHIYKCTTEFSRLKIAGFQHQERTWTWMTFVSKYQKGLPRHLLVLVFDKTPNSGETKKKRRSQSEQELLGTPLFFALGSKLQACDPNWSGGDSAEAAVCLCDGSTHTYNPQEWSHSQLSIPAG